MDRQDMSVIIGLKMVHKSKIQFCIQFPTAELMTKLSAPTDEEMDQPGQLIQVSRELEHYFFKLWLRQPLRGIYFAKYYG